MLVRVIRSFCGLLLLAFTVGVLSINLFPLDHYSWSENIWDNVFCIAAVVTLIGMMGVCIQQIYGVYRLEAHTIATLGFVVAVISLYGIPADAEIAESVPIEHTLVVILFCLLFLNLIVDFFYVQNKLIEKEGKK
jgi:hypothetical protein